MTISGMLLVGLVAGTVARAVWEGPQPRGVLATLALGMAGLALGAVLSGMTGVGRIVAVSDVSTWLTATTWTCVLLAAYGGASVATRRLGARVGDAPHPSAQS
jgi:uncharacterized membrane protein YeaQ/YmgE (transglycosylase-associated protein family)